MAEGLRIKVGADIIEFTRSINQVEQEIKDLSKSIKGLSGQDLVRANKELDKLNETAQRLRNVGKQGFDQFGVSLAKIGPSAAGAVPALNSLGQVARDLPFGFIAIQNNLPIVLDQFSALSRASGGTGAALKALGASLFGPAGLAFAFGAVTAGVTALIQKYGSLSGAFNALIGGTKQLTEAQKKSVEGISDELANISLLVNLYPQLAGRREEQDKILKKLNQSAPTYFKSLDSERVTVDQLTKSYDKYVKSLLGKIFIESQQERLREVAKKYAEDLVRLNDAQVKGSQQREKDANKLKNEIDLIERLGKAQQNLRGDIAVGVEVVATKKTFDEAFQDIINNFKKQADAILGGTEQIVQKLDFGSIFEDATAKEVKIVPDIDVPGSLQVLTNQTRDFGSAFSDQVVRDIQEAFSKLKVNGRINIIPSTEVQNAIGGLEFIKNKTAEITSQFNDFLAPAIDTAFGALANGQSVGQALAQSFKALLVQLTATVVKALALKAILSALNLGTGGAAGGIAGVIGGIAGAISGGGIANPSFGGLSSGGLQLGGSVNLSVRGTDLVGAINGANSQIRRVG
jgi:DNA repair exonuclease SbcCD ATPase subunit